MICRNEALSDGGNVSKYDSWGNSYKTRQGIQNQSGPMADLLRRVSKNRCPLHAVEAGRGADGTGWDRTTALPDPGRSVRS